MSSERIQNRYHALLGVFLLGLLCFTPTRAEAVTVDFLGAEGAPASVVNGLAKGLRRTIKKQKGFKLLPPNSMDLNMARMTLGCMGDSSGCMQKLGSMRPARWLFHVRVLPIGSRAKALFRKIDGRTGKTIKKVTLIFKKTSIKRATSALSGEMFGFPPVKMRPTPVARRVVRRAPPRRVIAKRIAPVRREPPPRRVALVVPLRREPPPRRVALVVPLRREVPPPVRRAIVKRSVLVRSATLVRKEPPRRIVIKRVTPPRRVAMVRRRPAKTPPPSTPLWQKPAFWGWITVGVAVASVGGVLAFGLDAQTKQQEVEKLVNNSRQGAPISYKEKIVPLENQGRNSAIMANVFVGIATAAVLGSVILFLIPPKKPQPTHTQLNTSLPKINLLKATPSVLLHQE